MELKCSTRQAYSEIDGFLKVLDEKKRNEIPLKLREYFEKEKDKEYKKEIHLDVPLKEQKLKSETLALIAVLNLQYWCDDETEKERLKQVYSNNERQYQKELNEKYNTGNIFRKDKIENEEMVALINIKKEKWYKRIVLFFRRLFNK